MKNWVNGLKAEFNKIIWTGKEELIKQTGVVVIATIVIGVVIVCLDFLIEYGLNFIINI